MKKLNTCTAALLLALMLSVSAVPSFAQDVDACCTITAAQQNQLASTKIMVANLNKNLATIYLGAFSNWKISVDAGRISNANPPQPPNGYVVSDPDAQGFQWPVIGNSAVVPMPPLPDDHFTVVLKIPSTIDVGKAISGSWFSVGPKDTLASGSTTPPGTVAADGTVGIFQKYGAPVGPGWYLKQ